MGTEGQFMNLHEYQSKQLFAQYAIPVPKGEVAGSPEEVVAAALKLGGSLWVVKAQVHAGERGSDEEAAAAYIHENVSKPMVAYIAGVAALEAAGITTVRSPAEMGSVIAKRLRHRGRP
jgi:succinyl-CoA synthetase beta subunit